MNSSNNLEEGIKLALDYSKLNVLIPVVAQDAGTGQVLMLAYANREAFEKTIQTGFATFWSRSRKKLWVKGEESGNKLLVKEVLVDCDQDGIVYLVEMEKGGACHTKYEDGAPRASCFYRKLNPAGTLEFLGRAELDRKSSGIGEVIEREYAQISERLLNPKEGSETTRMLQDPYRAARKLAEEAWEVGAAQMGNEGKSRQAAELADLIYRATGYMVKNGITLQELAAEMRARQK